ncbi:hypothetical protein [Chromobacterium sphagni]|uniref:Uncharacterized protein n=1 Tax=Chromobacterium sphagni TaxID=1903179 RepID=A0A1S1WZF8_9NEIS|nr:hypothetical protein [Chromobacterium sphagni]OHX12510.1 hypothetical protein BI347_02575 [Chromobacterium sphagni]OHX21405.1 hypothetical protein BI344_02425 [Chromobacterium sphagni]
MQRLASSLLFPIPQNILSSRAKLNAPPDAHLTLAHIQQQLQSLRLNCAQAPQPKLENTARQLLDLHDALGDVLDDGVKALASGCGATPMRKRFRPAGWLACWNRCRSN